MLSASGFPLSLIKQLLCLHDGGSLEPEDVCIYGGNDAFIIQGGIRCATCHATYTIDNGILNMLNQTPLDDEFKHEQQLRNKYALGRKEKIGVPWWSNDDNLMEMYPTLEALSIDKHKTLLELGCGDGRYTVELSRLCKTILAIDFSIESLRKLQQRLKNNQNVGLVLGDITTMKIKTSFDRVLATLVSNLPTRHHRKAMYYLAATALKPDGRFVYSVHNQGYRQRLHGETKSGRYFPGGIYRYNFTKNECIAEVEPYFNKVSARPIQIYFPLAKTLRLPLLTLSRLSERIPILNNLGELILCTADQPA